MNIQQGLFDHIVLQRTSRNQSDAAFAGTCGVEGSLHARVTAKGRKLRGFDGVKVGLAAHGALRGRLRGLPSGGPYQIDFRIVNRAGECLDRLRVRDVLVGDVWILAGQSNMEGIGYLKHAAKPKAMVRAFYMDDRWDVAKDPIHNLSQAVDPIHTELAGGKPVQRPKHVGTGPGVAFGQEMSRRRRVPQGLIACAHGGTPMALWDPAKKPLGGRSLYGAMLRRFEKNGGRIAGVAWYQGCGDASPTEAPRYLDRLRALIEAMRRDFRHPTLPVVVVQIGRVTSGPRDCLSWNLVQDLQRQAPAVIPHCATVPVIDLELDDLVHISGRDQNRLGKRLAQAMSVLCGDRKAGKPPIAFRDIRVERDPISGNFNVRIRFKHVAGELRANGRPAGFILGNPQPFLAFYRIDLDGDTVILKTVPTTQNLEATSLHYGYGTDPYCNITDSADRSLPVLGPIVLGQPPAMAG